MRFSTVALGMIARGIVMPVGIVLVGCGDPTAPSEAGPSLLRHPTEPTFDYSVPARFGLDQNGDGKIDYVTTAAEVDPGSWPVDFDACLLPASDFYWWFADGESIGTSRTCTFRHAFPSEGVYHVTLAVRGSRALTFHRRDVTVQDWLVVSFGDSYASGEGIPDIPGVPQSLIDDIDDALLDLKSARENLDAARDDLRIFDGACRDIDGWDDVQACAEALGTLRLRDVFQAFKDAKAHLEKAVQDARDAVAGIEAVVDRLKRERRDAVWQDDGCHRSAKAAPARAALALEQADPRTSVTFVHVACSGAKTGGVSGGQTDSAVLLIGTREVDAVLLSIGGNDAGFADIATACVVQELCSTANPQFNPRNFESVCSLLDRFEGDAGKNLAQKCRDAFEALPAQSAAVIFETRIPALAAGYAEVARSLTRIVGLWNVGFGMQEASHRDIGAGRVYITEYPDMTRSDDGAYCTTANRQHFLATLVGFSLTELQWADLTVAARLNREVAGAAGLHGWTYVGGIYGDFRTHGYCAAGRFVVRAHESFLIQGGIQGIAHPNNAGAARIALRIGQALEGDLYPLGRNGPPRAPAGRGTVMADAGL